MSIKENNIYIPIGREDEIIEIFGKEFDAAIVQTCDELATIGKKAPSSGEGGMIKIGGGTIAAITLSRKSATTKESPSDTFT